MGLTPEIVPDDMKDSILTKLGLSKAKKDKHDKKGNEADESKRETDYKKRRVGKKTQKVKD